MYSLCDTGAMSDVCRCDPPVPDSKSGGGLHEPKAGCAGSVLNLLDVQAFNHQAEVKTKVLEEECSLMMKQIFQRASCEAENEKEITFL